MLSAIDGRHAVDMIVTTIHAWRNNDHFDDVWKTAHSLKDVHGCAEPALPRPRSLGTWWSRIYRTSQYFSTNLKFSHLRVVSGILGRLQESSTKLDTLRHNFCDDINVTTLHCGSYERCDRCQNNEWLHESSKKFFSRSEGYDSRSGDIVAALRRAPMLYG